jgi:hypothetical protein
MTRFKANATTGFEVVEGRAFFHLDKLQNRPAGLKQLCSVSAAAAISRKAMSLHTAVVTATAFPPFGPVTVLSD